MIRWLALLIAAAEMSVSVDVGKTVSIDVGYAQGLICDDLSVVKAELRAASSTSNQLVLTGLKQGTTQCRAGTTGATASVLVHVTVK